MQLSRDAEESYLLAIRRDPGACIWVVPNREQVARPQLGAGPYSRADGSLMVYRNNVQERLHRRFYRLVRDPKLGRHRLERTCGTWGCFNPFHYQRSEDLLRGGIDHCPNGHPYTDGNLTPEGLCATCAVARAARKANHRPTVAQLNASKDHCPHGHPYTAENTYVYETKNGGHRRKCRACARRDAAERRRRERTAKAA